MKEKVEQALAKIRPALQADGGDVELVEVGDAEAERVVRFDGGEEVRHDGSVYGARANSLQRRQAQPPDDPLLS